jgi:flagellar biosynthesis/type III secretory pathway chaperone
MENKLFGYLQYEYQLLQEMIRLAERQQVALVKYQISELSEIISFQEALIKSIRDAEKIRIAYLMEWLGISAKEATEMQLSAIIKRIDDEEIINELKNIRSELRKSIERLYNLNATNRLLTNRARLNVKEMLGFITGGKAVCNVEV